MTNNKLWQQVEPLLWQGVKQNILPLSSACPLECQFCSNKFNPPGTLTYSIPSLPFAMLEQMAGYLDPGEKIVIGESATRIREGEPFAHPEIMPLLTLLRQKYPSTIIQITTSGIFLTETIVNELEALKPLELVISLNCISLDKRLVLMGPRAGTPQIPLEQLGERGITFHGSIVAMPHLVGWQELEKALKYLVKRGAATIRVFMPGFTSAAPGKLKISPAEEKKLYNFIDSLSAAVSTPIVMEPPRLDNLKGELTGVYLASPAANAGLKKGDIIVEIDGDQIFSRVNAFSKLKRAKDPSLEILRGGKRLEVKLAKEAGQSSGAIFAYDFDWGFIETVNRAIKRNKSSHPLLLTSHAAFPLWRLKQVKAKLTEGLDIMPVKGDFFGGNISCAGLITVEDFRRGLQKTLHKKYDKQPPDLVILPAQAFDPKGKDMRGESYLALEEMADWRVILA